MTALWQLSAVDQAAGIREGVFTATTLVESVLARVAEKNPELNAIVDPLDEQALLAAEPGPERLYYGSFYDPPLAESAHEAAHRWSSHRPQASGEAYEPVNYDGRFHGPVRLRPALANSYNIPAILLLQDMTDV